MFYSVQNGERVEWRCRLLHYDKGVKTKASSKPVPVLPRENRPCTGTEKAVVIQGWP